jgi:NOL1/NOP2/fmu family ribosome biogenesis protein
MMENCLLLPSTVELGLKISENGLKLSTRKEAGFEWLTKCTLISFKY